MFFFSYSFCFRFLSFICFQNSTWTFSQFYFVAWENVWWKLSFYFICFFHIFLFVNFRIFFMSIENAESSKYCNEMRSFSIDCHGCMGSVYRSFSIFLSSFLALLFFSFYYILDHVAWFVVCITIVRYHHYRSLLD